MQQKIKILCISLLSLLLVFNFFACKSTPEPVEQPEAKTEPVKEQKKDTAKEKKHQVQETVTVEDEPTLTLTIEEEVEDEYTRSVKAIETNEVITPDTFAEDKTLEMKYLSIFSVMPSHSLTPASFKPVSSSPSISSPRSSTSKNSAPSTTAKQDVSDTLTVSRSIQSNMIFFIIIVFWLMFY